MKHLALVVLLVPAIAWCTPPDWQQSVSSPKPGPFPNPPPLKATYRIGWMRIGAGGAQAVFTKPGRMLQLDVTGGSTGMIRKLWDLDVTAKAQARASTLRPLRLKQDEVYGWKRTTTELSFNDRGVTSQRHNTPPDATEPEKQKIQLPYVYDIFSAMLYIRSQRLEPGEKFNLIVFPGNATYLATARVIGTEKIQVKAGKFNAWKFELRLQKITPSLELVPHSKFKRGYIWVSDDANRILLRAEAEIFVGSVWLELQNVTFTDR